MDRPARPHRFSVPNVATIVDWLTRLETGDVTRSEASEWASEYVLFEDPQLYPKVENPKVWQALQRLMAADLKDTPGSYLYGEADFKAWRHELEAI